MAQEKWDRLSEKNEWRQNHPLPNKKKVRCKHHQDTAKKKGARHTQKHAHKHRSRSILLCRASWSTKETWTNALQFFLSHDFHFPDGLNATVTTTATRIYDHTHIHMHTASHARNMCHCIWRPRVLRSRRFDIQCTTIGCILSLLAIFFHSVCCTVRKFKRYILTLCRRLCCLGWARPRRCELPTHTEQ